MNVQETLAILEALRLGGAIHFKSQDFEVSMGPGTMASNPPTTVPESKPAPVAPVEGPPVQNVDATEKLKNLIDTLKMDDSQLLDKIFPAGAGG